MKAKYALSWQEPCISSANGCVCTWLLKFWCTSGCARSHCQASQMWIRSGSASEDLMKVHISLSTWKASMESQSNTSVDDSKAANMSVRRKVDVFFSIGPSVLIGLCSLYRVETSAPGLSGHYWYKSINYSHVSFDADKTFHSPHVVADWGGRNFVYLLWVVPKWLCGRKIV